MKGHGEFRKHRTTDGAHGTFLAGLAKTIDHMKANPPAAYAISLESQGGAQDIFLNVEAGSEREALDRMICLEGNLTILLERIQDRIEELGARLRPAA